MFPRLNNVDVLKYWVPICFSGDVSHKPLKLTVGKETLAIWRGKKTDNIFVINDACPHRGASLAIGDVVADDIRCLYHGHILEGSRCIRASSACRTSPNGSSSYRAVDFFGIVWVTKSADRPFPNFRDNLFSLISSKYAFTDEINADALDIVFNTFDVDHFPYVHHRTFMNLEDTEFKCVPTYDHTDYGFVSRYRVPIRASGVFREFIGSEAQIADIEAFYFAPFAQIFSVRYNTGVSYVTCQATCPLGEKYTKYLQICADTDTFSAIRYDLLYKADYQVWLEDKQVLESLYQSLPADQYASLEDHEAAVISAIESVR